ncbi:MAG: hypothetical protein NC123_19115 [Butyrivibrio sp.]|nr:hypothetical protein [Acetatifactor muris]MCM1561622.1 hypothetical protein [Butyrivibrio sp.]
MLYTQFNLEDAKEVWYEEAYEDGMMARLVGQVCRKINKGKSVEMAAAELEMDMEEIRPVYTVASEFAPDYDLEKIMQKLQKL